MLFLTLSLPSPLFFKALSKNLSENKTNNPPIIKPSAGITHGIYPSSTDLSIAGDKSDQKDAAIITPALKPKIVFKTFLFKSLKKQTVKAPKAVIPHVNVVAISA